MEAVVIPWFLALTSFVAINNTQIPKDNGAVYEPGPNHGFIYVYNVDIDFLRSPERNAVVDYVLNFTSTLECRPRNESVLFCSLEERKMDSVDYKHNRHYTRIQTGKESFEIDFNEAGVQSLRVSSLTASYKRFELVKMIVSQFNLGTDFGKRNSFSFTTNETSWFGECETVYNVMEATCTGYPKKEEIRLKSIFHDSFGDSVVIRKRRNTRNCDRPNEVSLIENSESILSTVTSSYSEIHICPDSFESSTIVEGKAISINEDAQASVFRQIVKIRLENVVKAEEDLPTFAADTAIDTIYLHKEVDNNESDT